MANKIESVILTRLSGREDPPCVGPFQKVRGIFSDGKEEEWNATPDPTPTTPPPESKYGYFKPFLTEWDGSDLEFIPGPDFPASGDIVFQVWSLETNKVEAARTVDAAPWIYPKGKLATVTPGKGTVQALIRNASRKQVAKVEAEGVTFPKPAEHAPLPLPEIPAPRPTPDDIEVTAANASTALKALKDGRRLLFPRGEKIILPYGIVITQDGVTIEAHGEGDIPQIVGNNNINVILSIAGQAAGTLVQDVMLTSQDPYGLRPQAINNAGTNSTFRRIEAHNVTYFFNNKPSARKTLVDGCTNPKAGGVNEHWFWDNGSSTTIQGCTCLTPGYTFYRCNDVDDVAILNNIIVGGPKQQGRITIQRGKNLRVFGNTANDTEFGCGPMNNKNAWEQAGDTDVERKVNMLAARCINVSFENNQCTNVLLRIGNRCEHVRVENNPGLKVAPPDKDTLADYPGAGFMLPGAKDVIIDGEKKA